MLIKNNFNAILNFKGATININALSDTHGQIQYCNRAYNAMLDNDCFEKEQIGKANYLIVGGDWFMSGDKKGFLSKPNKPLAMFQLDMFNNFVKRIKEICPNNMTIFTLGNHEFDGGNEILQKTIKDIDAKVVAGNLDFENSPMLENEINSHKIVKSSITYVEDDKNPNKKYAILNLACAPFNMLYYADMQEGINFIENKNVSQKKIQKEDYEKSLKLVEDEIKAFKKQNKDGVVVLTCHTGSDFAKDCANLGNIDLIFDAHMHEDKMETVNGTSIISLSQNFDKIVNAKIKIDDDGNLTDKIIKTIRPLDEKYASYNKDEFYENLFKADIKNVYQIKSLDDSINSLSIDGIRNNSNSHLANFITDIILSQIQKYDDSVDIFALNSTSIRNGFNLKEGKNVSQFDVLNCLNGLQINQAEIFVNELTGKQLLDVVIDNIISNCNEPKKNPISHYSGLTIKKDEFLKAYFNNESDLYKYVIFEKTNKPIEPDKIYKIANAKKYFKKSKNPVIKELFNTAVPLNKNILDLFVDYFKNNQYIEYAPKTRIISDN